MTFLRRAFVVLLGLVLLAAPVIVRTSMMGYTERSYQPPDDPGITFAATVAPTATAVALAESSAQNDDSLRRGGVIVDMAHFNNLNPAAFQPLGDALAERGLGLRVWLSKIDPFTIENFLDYPDQSEDLAPQLADASALIVISPFFLWTPQEIALVERFVADGGRLLLISDPDVFGDFAAITNFVGEPFGVVFNDDYLYDTVENDTNYTHFYQGEFRDQAAALNGARIAFYGGRSIDGSVKEQAVSAQTTRSSLRTGATGFTTVAIGGEESNGTAGRVVALSDFDVLTEPYLTRHDNRLLVEFVASFLAADQRINLVADFPNYLGKQVAITFGSESAISAELLLLGAQLQKRLEQTSRTLDLTSALVLTDTEGLAQTANLSPTTDLIYLADYETAAQATTLLADAGITLLEEMVTPTVTPIEPTATPTPPASSAQVTASITTSGEITSSVAISASVDVTSTEALTATATPTPTIMHIVQTSDGLRFQAEQTVLVLQQRTAADGRLVLAVLGADEKGISAGVSRLLSNDFAECLTGAETTFCPLPADDKSTTATKSEEDTGDKTDNKSETSGEGGGDDDSNATFTILLIDDNQAAGEGEISEADVYLQALLAAGHAPDLWTTADQNTPTVDDLASYDWVIWSNAGYAESEISEENLELLTGYIVTGGHLTLSSRAPLIGAADSAPSTVRDVVVDDDAPELTEGLPETPIGLVADLPPAVPLTTAQDEAAARIVLRRGPESDDADAPALFVLGDEATGARLHVSGIAMTWLPEENAQQLIQNLAQWMAQE